MRAGEPDMKKCLMLDVDGVLVNGRPADGGSWASDIERDLGIAPATLQEAFFRPHWEDVVLGRKGLREALEACLPRIAPSLAPETFLAYWFERDAALDQALLAECDELRGRGARIFLATNQEHLRAAWLMEHLKLGAHVDGMVYSARVGARKPEAAFFAAAQARAGAAPEDILLVDDTRANVEAAVAAGWRGRQWTKGASLMRLMDEAWSG